MGRGEGESPRPRLPARVPAARRDSATVTPRDALPLMAAEAPAAVGAATSVRSAPRPAVPPIPGADPDARDGRAPRLRRHQHLLFVPGEPIRARRAAAREGDRRGVADRAVHPADRSAARLRGAAAARRRRRRAAPHRIPEAPAPGAGGHRHRADRRRRSRADRGIAARDGRSAIRQGPLGRARVSQRQARQAVVRPRVLPQGNRALHDDCDPLRQRQRPGDDRRRQSQVHLGRRLADQDRRQGQGLRRRRQGLPHRRSRHRARAAQDEPRQPAAREGRGRTPGSRRAGDVLDRPRRRAGAHLDGADRDARLERVRRAAGRRGLREAERVDRCARGFFFSRAS